MCVKVWSVVTEAPIIMPESSGYTLGLGKLGITILCYNLPQPVSVVLLWATAVLQ
jgi:hypothetical protein